MSHDYDVLIIGGGPAGIKCALELGKAGKKVGLVEKEEIGGTCLNQGCIPSKTYLYLAELFENIKKAKRHGIHVSEPEILWEEAKKRKDMNVKMLGMGLKKSLEAHHIEIISGEGKLVGKNEVLIQNTDGEKRISAECIVLAMGSTALFLPIMQKGEHVISAKELLDIDHIPQSLVIIGGGVTGVEMASVFSVLGTKVTIIEKMPSLLPAQDPEITEVLKKSLQKKGCEICLGAEVICCKESGIRNQELGKGNVEIVYKNAAGEESSFSVEKALIVIGRVPNYDLSELEKIGIKNNGRRVVLSDHLQTSALNVYMIGDAGGKNLTAYGGEREGESVAAHILGNDRKINSHYFPVTVFSHPEVAQIGSTEEELRQKGIEFEVRRGNYAANGKAVIMGEREGIAKILVEKKSKKILGVHIIGVHAADLIHQAILPVMKEMTLSEWNEMVWSHPVLSEVLKSALESDAE
ncbi:dihydrolipoyl dehydrogenase [Candidatus Peregrinibacteria bacterium]|nr:dihydrolipoyl dehydrogenase [Candidatus Peregrinibacteria bacterium]